LGTQRHTEGHHCQAQCRNSKCPADPTVHSRLVGFVQEIFPRDQQTPQKLGALHSAEIEKWWPIIKTANIKGE